MGRVFVRGNDDDDPVLREAQVETGRLTDDNDVVAEVRYRDGTTETVSWDRIQDENL